MKLTKLQQLAEGKAEGRKKVFKMFDPLTTKMEVAHDNVKYVMVQLESAVLTDLLKQEGFPETESKAAKAALKAAYAAVGKAYDELSDLHMALGMHFEDDLNESLSDDLVNVVRGITKKLLPHEDMAIEDIQVDEYGIEFNVTADFKEHHPSMIGFQKNIKPFFSRIGFEKDDFGGRYYQLLAAKKFTPTEVASIKKALGMHFEDDDLKEVKEPSGMPPENEERIIHKVLANIEDDLPRAARYKSWDTDSYNKTIDWVTQTTNAAESQAAARTIAKAIRKAGVKGTGWTVRVVVRDDYRGDKTKWHTKVKV